MMAKNDEADAAAGSKRQQRRSIQTVSLQTLPSPNVTCPQRRAKLHLQQSGLLSKSKTDPSDPSVFMGRLLGSSTPKVRHQGLHVLEHYLKQRSGISELDCAKVWKALYVCLYMADTTSVQEVLAERIAKLLWIFQGTLEQDEYAGQVYLSLTQQEEQEDRMDDDDDDECGGEQEQPDPDDDGEQEHESDESQDEELVRTLKDDNDNDNKDEDDNDDNDDDSTVEHCRGAHLVSLWVRTGLVTIRKHWKELDKWRVDKFYTLVRYVVREMYDYMAQRCWNVGIVRLFNDALLEEVLLHPTGIRLHVVDLALEELALVNAKAPLALTEATFLDCMEPFLLLAQTGGAADGGGTAASDVLQQRVVEKIILPFLDGSVLANDPKDVKFDQVHVGTIATFLFDLASDGAVVKDTYRKSLYDVYKLYKKRLNDVGRDVELNVKDEDGEDDNVDSEGEQEMVGQANDDQDVVVKASNDGSFEESAKVDRNRVKGEERSSKTTPSLKSNAGVVGSQQDAAATPEATAKMSNKKKHKKAKKRANVSDAVDIRSFPASESKQAVAGVGNADTKLAGKAEKRKRKKKRKHSEVDQPTTKPALVEEELSISLSDQKAALKAMKKQAANDVIREPAAKKQEPVGNKRVKFGSFNRSRSWKASMDGLRNKAPPSPAVTSPDKGILLNKHAVKNSAREKKRRKAIDYF